MHPGFSSSQERETTAELSGLMQLLLEVQQGYAETTDQFGKLLSRKGSWSWGAGEQEAFEEVKRNQLC